MAGSRQAGSFPALSYGRWLLGLGSIGAESGYELLEFLDFFFFLFVCFLHLTDNKLVDSYQKS